MAHYFSKEMLKKLSYSKGLGHQTRTRLFLLSLVLLIVALARPVVEKEQLDTSEAKSSLIIAIDFSKSMHQTDIYPSHLALALKKLDRLLAKATQLDIGILFYANDAYMLYPLSQNPTLLRKLLKDANITHTFADNTNLFSALEASAVLFKTHSNKHLLILSDAGENVSRAKELSYVQKHHITLSSLALTPTPKQRMKMLCKQSGGIYRQYSWGDEDVQALLKFFTKRHPNMQSYHYALKQYREYYMFPLLLGLMILLFLWRPHLSPRLLLFCFLSYGTTPSQASILDTWREYQQAKTYNQATQAYKNKHYTYALKLYKNSLGENPKRNAKIYHNIATTYARSRKLSLAKKYYEKSLQSFPLAQSKENLALINKQLKEERKVLHKKYQKLLFKSIAGKQQYKTRFTSYSVKLHTLLPDEETRWFNKVLKHKSPLYLQKIPTHLRSLDANVSQ